MVSFLLLSFSGFYFLNYFRNCSLHSFLLLQWPFSAFWGLLYPPFSILFHFCHTFIYFPQFFSLPSTLLYSHLSFFPLSFTLFNHPLPSTPCLLSLHLTSFQPLPLPSSIFFPLLCLHFSLFFSPASLTHLLAPSAAVLPFPLLASSWKCDRSWSARRASWSWRTRGQRRGGRREEGNGKCQTHAFLASTPTPAADDGSWTSVPWPLWCSFPPSHKVYTVNAMAWAGGGSCGDLYTWF